MYITSAEIAPETGRVTSHAITIFRKIDQLTLSLERTRPTNTTEPTLQWVVEMGNPILLAMRTAAAAPTSMHTPLTNGKQIVQSTTIKNIIWKQLKQHIFKK